jgi:hypothetical protein
MIYSTVLLAFPLVALVVPPCFCSCHVFGFFLFLCSNIVWDTIFLNCGFMYSLDLCGHVDVLYDVCML